MSSKAWEDATLAAAVFAVDPAGIGGVHVRSPAGPVRDRWLAALTRALPTPPRRMPVGIADDRLLGGLDLAGTLQAGRPVAQRGLLADADGGVVLAVMAERLPPGTAAKMAAVIDRHEVVVERDGVALSHPTRFGVVAFDEGGPDDDPVPVALTDRLGLKLDFTQIPPREAPEIDFGDVADARALLPRVRCGDEALQALVQAAVALGIASLRAPLHALRVACAHAALNGRDTVEAEDAAAAARLVFAPRATQLPAPPEQEQEAPPEEPPPPPDQQDPNQDPPPPDNEQHAEELKGPMEDQVLDAVLASLPPALLAQMQADYASRERARSSGKSGALHKGGHRGRPSGIRRGEPKAGQRLNLIATLRAAAPWQRVRGAVKPRVQVRPDDFHVTHYRQRRETTTIFVVDASGSSALNRMAEAKGAVELLLADCYVRRDKVAVIAFRGKAAELLLPPTRSLVRAKRSLAGLPGGGGTPLAAAVDAAGALAESIRRRGDTPLVVFLTDGRANVALDGTGGRPKAEADALDAAKRMLASGAATMLIDTSPQPAAQARKIAGAMQATYMPLPYAGAQTLSQVVRARAGG
ncbi:magnesium chelatase subunit D [Rubrivivax benzoatilyticus]|uniref:Magnesium chelatase subunit D n=1 Tax=Rubrivivax benzoatilyticus TaxID=316997 RepID=A0ABX0I322_9BURK|nr:magnesium chelatase subunit D [Rubrivivax benzoatilyticus]EGJ08781.1 magnesium chelatase subunit D [Rubrivivax benzoatilyticus JA2 = ATCC BAA-35]NHK99945.1 magnesium chelatase subunit D [Rubrivivax benzoatilyticus]NHL25776.1 magnesium chelatase subunit D [Rubrivivax benzoatilyticus]